MNLWDKLPGEIKNQIYKLVFAQDEDLIINIGAKGIASFNGFHRSFVDDPLLRHTNAPREQLTSGRWCEPRLFRVSKTIRKEAMDFYFTGRKFQLTIAGGKPVEGLAWLGKLINMSDKSTLDNWQVELNTRGWHHVYDWFHISSFIMKQDVVDAAVDTPQSVRDELMIWLRQFGFLRKHLVPMDIAFKEMVEMTVKAKRRGTKMKWLEQDLKDWAWNRNGNHYHGVSTTVDED